MHASIFQTIQHVGSETGWHGRGHDIGPVQGIQDPAPGINKNYPKVKIDGIDTKKVG